MNLKDRKIPLIAGGAAVVVILLLLIFMPSDKSGDQGPEVISKRVKIELQDTEADISASADASTDAGALQPIPAAPAETPVAAPAAVAKPAAPPALPDAKSGPAQAKTEGAAKTVASPAPAPKKFELTVKEVNLPPVEKAEPKPVRTVKAEKKAAEAAKKPTVKRLSAANAWTLNIASFPSLSEAQGLAGKLKKGGYNAYVSGFTKDSVRWHRVRVGFYASRDEAARAGKAIQAKFRVDKPWITRPEAAELKAHL